jgi:hypothetical protein
MCSQIVSAKSNWNQLYKIVKKDIRTIESLGTRDLQLTIRLFELYGEKLTLLLEKESEYRINFLSGSDDKKLLKLKKIQKKTLDKIEKIARKIARRTRDRNILAKVDYYKALNYFLIKDQKSFYKYIKLAERKNTNKKLAFNINMKLADYFYNEKKYESAKRYYLKVIPNTKSKWITRFHFNLAWSYLKLNKQNLALKHIKLSYKLSKNKRYFKIGKQLVDSLILFFAYTHKTQDGVKYLKKNNLATFDHLLQYLHYIFENGDKKTVDIVLSEIRNSNLNLDQEHLFLAKKILILRTLRKRKVLQKDFHAFKKLLKRKSKENVKDESINELVLGINSYTGYLQELIRSKRLLKHKTKQKYIKYVGVNFNLLKHVDKANSLKYSFYEGETYFSLQNYLRASYIYASGIREFKKTKKMNDKFLNKSFDALFKSLEYQSKPNEKLLMFTYNSFIYFYPKKQKSSQIFQRMIGHYTQKRNTKKVLHTLKRYNNLFPEDISKQRQYYKGILNGYIDKKDLASLNKLQSLLKNKFLSFKQSEILKVEKIINQIKLDKYETLAKNGEIAKAIIGFTNLFTNKKNSKVLRISAIRKKMYFQEKHLHYEDLGDTIKVATKYYTDLDKKKYGSEIVHYIEKICLGDEISMCFDFAEQVFKDKVILASKLLKNVYFKSRVVLNKNFKITYKYADTFEKKNYLLQTLLLKNPSMNSAYYLLFTSTKLNSIIVESIKAKFWKLYFSTLSMKKIKNYVSKTKLVEVKNSLLNDVNQFESIIKQVKRKLPVTPPAENITFAQFSKFNNDIVKSFLALSTQVNQEMKVINPNFIPQYLSLVIKNLESEGERIKKFIPTSSDVELEKAINSELNNIQLVIDKKILELRQNYYKSVSATSLSSGGRRYFESIMTNPVNYNLRGPNLWRN